MIRAVIWSVLFGLVACKGGERRPSPSVATPAADPEPRRPERDPHSQGRPDEIAVKHLSLDLEVDFASKVLAGTAKLSLERRDPAAREVVLDTDGLTIESVVDCTSTQPVPFALGPETKRLGRALSITPASDCVAIGYKTSPDAKALLWVEPSGTAGKQHPMLFTQSQAILARTWIPLQDSPGVRFTYDARVRVPDGVRPVMSAENPAAPDKDGVWVFQMPQPIPSYLMAIAVGDLAFQPLGARTGVYAEPSMLDAAAHEFAEVEGMMTAAETLYGPYRWGRYDILVLPPSFPYGGMENPRLTFLTPTVIVGDRSAVSLIAHELAHSWSGNLVTNSTWNDMWLNEGFTTYVERRIMEELRGPEIADIGWALGRMDLDGVLAEAAAKKYDTRLALDYTADGDPEEVPSDITYEKGALLLRAMELAFGREDFDRFLRARFDRLAFQSTDTRTFVADAEAALFSNKDVGWTLAEWLHQPGLPPSAPPSSSTRVAALEQQAVAFATSGTLPDATAWNTTEWIAFLRKIPKDVSCARLEAIDARYQLTKSPNALIAMRWLPLLIAADVREAAPTVEDYLVRVGRRWLVTEVYQAMLDKNAFWRDAAAKAFAKARTGYHPVTRDTVADMLAKQPASEPG